MKLFTTAFSLLALAASAQDVVLLTNGADLNIKITGNNAETISFYRGNENALPYYISKSEITEIRYENGTIETPEHPMLTVAQAKDKVINHINNFASDPDKNKITATFEDQYLKLTANKGDYKKGMVFDLVKLIRFDETSFRREGYAFINIWCPFRVDERKNKWDKFKMVLRVETHEDAAVLTASIKQLNKVLKANR